MRDERRQSTKNKIRLEVKRSTELWLYSFADMYMIIAVLFIATTALYAKKAREMSTVARKPTQVELEVVPTAGRGPATAQVSVAIEFKPGSAEIDEEAVEQLGMILPLITDVKSGTIDLEGYADRKELGNKEEYSSNLDLSAVRAVRVAEWFIKKGVNESRIRTTSFGRGHRFASGKTGTMSDRRVVVKFYSAGS